MSTPRLPPTATGAVQDLKARTWTQERRLKLPGAAVVSGAGRPDWLKLTGSTTITDDELYQGPTGTESSSPGARSYLAKKTSTLESETFGEIPKHGIVALQRVAILIVVSGVWYEEASVDGERGLWAMLGGTFLTGDGPETPGALSASGELGRFTQAGSLIYTLERGSEIYLGARSSSSAEDGILLEWELGAIILEPDAPEVDEGGET